MNWNLRNILLAGLGVILFYIIGVLSLYIFINSILFKCDKVNRYDFGYTYNIEEFPITLAESQEIHSILFKTNNSEKAIILYLHGVNGNLNAYYHFSINFRSRNLAVLMPEFRGFGKSKGNLTESSLNEDALACMEWLRKRYREDSIIIYAQDFLAPVALELASMIPCRFVVLENPVFSLKRWMRDRFPALMMPYELKYDFDTYQTISKSISPVYIIQSSRSAYCNPADAKKLQFSLRDPNSMIFIEHSRTEKLFETEKYQQVLDQLLSF